MTNEYVTINPDFKDDGRQRTETPTETASLMRTQTAPLPTQSIEKEKGFKYDANTTAITFVAPTANNLDFLEEWQFSQDFESAR